MNSDIGLPRVDQANMYKDIAPQTKGGFFRVKFSKGLGVPQYICICHQPVCMYFQWNTLVNVTEENSISGDPKVCETQSKIKTRSREPADGEQEEIFLK